MKQILKAFCKQCNKSWKPYGDTFFEIPYYVIINCPNCGVSNKLEWLDEDTQRKRVQKELGLDKNFNVESKITQLENEINLLREGRNADRSEIENLRQLIDLAIQKDIKELKENTSSQEYDKNFLQGQITKLENTLEEIKQLSLKDRKDLE